MVSVGEKQTVFHRLLTRRGVAGLAPRRERDRGVGGSKLWNCFASSEPRNVPQSGESRTGSGGSGLGGRVVVLCNEGPV